MENVENDESFFPKPPEYFKNYTEERVAQDDPALQPPSFQPMVDANVFHEFGAAWPVQQSLPTLEQMGVPRLFGVEDPGLTNKEYLAKLLDALLSTYHDLVKALAKSPPSLAHHGPAAFARPNHIDHYLDHLRIVAINMHYLINDLRIAQARGNLESLVTGQAQRRSAQATSLAETVDSVKRDLVSRHAEIVELLRAPDTTAGGKASLDTTLSVFNVEEAKSYWAYMAS